MKYKLRIKTREVAQTNIGPKTQQSAGYFTSTIVIQFFPFCAIPVSGPVNRNITDSFDPLKAKKKHLFNCVTMNWDR